MTETTQPLSLGQQLNAARSALNLSIDDVAQKTNLKKAHIQALEDDIFILANVPPAFVRGYVRSYVRFLHLPETLVGTVNYGEVTIPKEVKKVTVAPMPVVRNHKSQMRWVKVLTWVVLLSTVGMTLTWWWQEHQKDQASSEQLVAVTVETPTVSENSVPVVIASEAIEITPPITQPEPIVTSQLPVAQPVPEPEPVKIEMPVVQQPIQTVEPVNVLLQPAPTAIEVPTVEEVQDVVVNDELRIEITHAQSWITVRGAKNKKLAEKLYNMGEVLTFNGNEQYRLTVGAPANVKIYYQGQLVPLKVDGRVARFKLPLAN